MVKLHLRQHENLPYVGLSITYFFGSFDVFITFRIYPFNKKKSLLDLEFLFRFATLYPNIPFKKTL